MTRLASEHGVSLDALVPLLRGRGIAADLRGAGGVTVSGVSQDSRTIETGDLFLAWRGTRFDAHEYVADAARAGATAALVERWVDAPLPQIRVSDGRSAAAIVAQRAVGDPWEALSMTAVTGTNGKTTCALLTREIFSAGNRSAALGTLGMVGPHGDIEATGEQLTTPGPVEVARVLSELWKSGVTTVTMEASSHALEQRRLDGVRFDTAVFTNLSHDHLDYHETLDAYRASKARLLLLLKDEAGVVVNGGDPSWAQLPTVDARLIVFGLEEDPDIGRPACSGVRLPDLIAEDIALSGEGSRFKVRWGGEEATVSLPLLGRFNVENALAALGAALLLGMDLGEAAERLSEARAPIGRMEVAVRDPVPVIIDYAHTPAALERVLETVRPLFTGRVILVFGAGGDRDPSKRAHMGRIAGAAADLAIVTSDNPRTEDPESIVDDIVTGMGGAAFERVTDRREAIERALEVARPGDVVLLAGKGHETYQVVGTERRPFDEREVLRDILESGRAA